MKKRTKQYITPKVVEKQIKPNYFFSHVNLVDGFNIYGNVLAQYGGGGDPGSYECCCGNVDA